MMKMNYRILMLLVGALWCFSTTSVAKELTWQDYTLKAKSGDEIAAKLGILEVPASHVPNHDNGKSMQLTVVKLPTTANSPKSPIVYLAGGPGGSGVSAAKGKRFALFAKLREISDVIIFEQRGTGLSRGKLNDCRYTPKVSMAEHFTRQSLVKELKSAGEYCQGIWQAQGVNLNHYTTLQSAGDLEALRVAIGAQKLNLWGISYGTHLAMAMAKYYPDSIDRMVLASSEGLDQTIKLPKYSDKHLARIADAVKKDKDAAKRYPDLLKLMADVHQKYRDNPIEVEFKHPKIPQAVKVGVSDIEIQLMTAYMLGRDREQIAMLPGAYTAMLQNDFSRLAPYFYQLKKMMWQFNPMSAGMDGASGISQSRWQQVKKQSEKALLWRTHNLPYPDMSVAVDDLGDKFRASFKSDIPSLFIAGSLDGRTFIQEQRQNASQFSQSVFLTVEGGGHNLFMLSPVITEQITKFFDEQKLDNKTVNLTEIKFL